MTVAKIIGKDGINSLYHTNRSIVNFEQVPDVNLPEDIAAMLTPP